MLRLMEQDDGRCAWRQYQSSTTPTWTSTKRPRTPVYRGDDGGGRVVHPAPGWDVEPNRSPTHDEALEVPRALATDSQPRHSGPWDRRVGGVAASVSPGTVPVRHRFLVLAPADFRAALSMRASRAHFPHAFARIGPSRGSGSWSGMCIRPGQTWCAARDLNPEPAD